MEQWKPVKGFKEFYEVSNQGRIKSLRHNKIMSPAINNGYQRACFTIGWKPYREYVHTLVLEAFISPRPRWLVCDHIDGNKLNNFVENLEWVAIVENTRRGKRSETNQGERSNLAKLNEAKILQIRKRYAKGGIFHRELAKEFGVSQSGIQHIINRETWRHV